MSPNPYRHECEYFTEGCVKCHLGVAWFEGHDYRNQEVADLTAKLDEAGDCKARAVAIDEQNQRLRKFIFELCPHETYLATSMGWIRDQIARASDCEALKVRLEQSKKLYEMTLANEMNWMKKWEEVTKERDEARVACAEMQSTLRTSLKIPKAWMRGHITFEQWDAACQKVFDAIDKPICTNALEARLREARLEVADDIFRVLVAGEDKKCAEVVSWLMRYIDDIAAMKGAK